SSNFRTLLGGWPMAAPECLLDHALKVGQAKGLREQANPLLTGALNVRRVRRATDQDEGTAPADRFGELPATHPRHDEIGQDEGERAGVKERHRRATVVGRHHLIAEQGERVTPYVAD